MDSMEPALDVGDARADERPGPPAKTEASFAARHGLVALDDIIRLRSRIGSQLFPVAKFAESDLRLLDGDPAFACLSDYRFTAYSMEPSALAFLKTLIAETRPRVVVELGSGLSTAVLARAQRDARPDDPDIYYISVEQGEAYAQDSLAMVRRAGIEHVRFLVAEMVPVAAHGVETRCYNLPPDYLERTFDGAKADLVVIDGPVSGGPTGVREARFPTVPLLRPILAEGALICLDDALRDIELWVAGMWRQLPYVEMLGLKIVGKGTAVARVKPA
jgi:hypothetical protein